MSTLLRHRHEGNETKVCAECGESFRRDKRNTWAQWERAQFCSRKCTGAAKTKRDAASRPPLREVFEKWFTKTDGCWIWAGAVDKDGYGIFSYARKSNRASKVALQLDGRPVPDGLYACHTCDNPSCVNPAHLYPGTPTQNVQDALDRGRMKVGERSHWSKLTAADVVAIRESDETPAEMARRYGVSQSNVVLIRQRKSWKSIA